MSFSGTLMCVVTVICIEFTNGTRVHGCWMRGQQVIRASRRSGSDIVACRPQPGGCNARRGDRRRGDRRVVLVSDGASPPRQPQATGTTADRYGPRHPSACRRLQVAALNLRQQLIGRCEVELRRISQDSTSCMSEGLAPSTRDDGSFRKSARPVNSTRQHNPALAPVTSSRQCLLMWHPARDVVVLGTQVGAVACSATSKKIGERDVSLREGEVTVDGQRAIIGKYIDSGA
jgi:hypothetical protein